MSKLNSFLRKATHKINSRFSDPFFAYYEDERN